MTKSAVQKMHEEFDGITASKAPIIAGVSPWSSPYELFMQMTGQLPPKEQTFQMWLGTQIEGIVVRAFTRETGLKVKRPHRAVDPNFWFVTEEYGFPMGALIDGACLDTDGPAGIEAKNASAWMLADWQEDVPVHYMVQIQHQLACTGWDHFYAAAIVGNQFIHHRVDRDEELIALITDKERDFYLNHLKPGIPPDVDGSEGTTNAIKVRWGQSSEPLVVLDDPEIERLAMVYQAQGKQIKGLETERDETGNRLKVILEDREGLQSRSKVIKWKTQEYDFFDAKTFRSENAELAEKYTSKRTKRPLTILEAKP